MKTRLVPEANPDSRLKPERFLAPDVLRRLPLLATLPDEELLALSRQMRVRRFARHEQVVNKGSSGDDLMFLQVGHLQVVDYTEDGREIGLNLIGQGAFFGELALVDGLPRSATIVALSPAVVAYLHKDAAFRLIYGNPVIAEKMIKHFARSIRNLSNYRALLAIPKAHQRVYALLCQIKRKDGSGGEEIIDGLPTQQQIAIMINTSRETVSRTFADLIHRGILRKDSRLIVVCNPRRLEQLASGH